MPCGKDENKRKRGTDWPIFLKRANLFVELDVCSVLKDGKQVGLDRVRVGGLAENFQEGGIRDEEESVKLK